MKSLTTVEAREHFSDLISRANYSKERVIVSRYGRDVAAIVPIEDVEMLETLEDINDLKEALAAKKEMKRKGEISWEALKKEEGLD